LRLYPTVYELCSFRLKDSSVTSVAVQRAFFRSGVIPPRRIGYDGARRRSRPRGWKVVPRRNEPSRFDFGVLRPPYTARHWAGSTTTYLPRKVPRTAREATKYHAPKEKPYAPHRSREGGPGISACTQGLCVMLLLSKGLLSHLCDCTRCFSRVRQYNDPFGSGSAGHDSAAAIGGETLSRGATNLEGTTAGLCGIPTR
jgi:hypothetical protein